jgi:hypothetical protein
MTDMRRYGVKSVMIKASPVVEAQLIKFGIVNDAPEIEEYAKLIGNVPIKGSLVLLPGNAYEAREGIQGK